ncbi:MAG TPA: acetate kinase [Pseudomonadales bacterium]|nr:acetate kinase [Pseudomonadales bacterium]
MTDPRWVLVLNAGSSSLKFSLVEETPRRTVLQGVAECLGTSEARLYVSGLITEQKNISDADTHRAIVDLLSLLNQKKLLQHIVAVGHRVVHGGQHFRSATLIDEKNLKAIEACNDLAPLHNPANVAGIYACQKQLPQCPQIAVFDTAFHHTLAPSAYLYGVPWSWHRDFGVRRYGFHGINHRYVAQQAAQVLQRPLTELALISAHLGNGCSTCAILNGESRDTSMGLTPLEGLIMGSRCGDIDPGLPHFLAQRTGWNLDEIHQALNYQSGLLGVSELSNDMRTLESAAQQGHAGAERAIELFCYRLAKSIASLTVALGRLDALIFTGGIGEHSHVIRDKTLRQLAFLNVFVDVKKNRQHGAHDHGFIHARNSLPVLIVPADEEVMIAEDTFKLLSCP